MASIPTSPSSWAQRGTGLLASGAFDEAQACFERAVELDPRVGTHWALLGKSQAMRFGYHAAHESLARACTLAPGAAYAHVWLGHALRERNDAEGAIAAFERASMLDPDDLNAAVGAALTTPLVYHDEHDIDRWRARYAAGLDRLRRDARARERWARSVFRLEWSNFYLAYQGRNDRELQIAWSDFLIGLLARAMPEWQRNIPARPDHPSRIAVAFVSANLCRHTVTDYFARWITDLPRGRFEVSVFHAGASVDERTQAFRAAADHFAHVPSDARALAVEVQQRRPDVIVYPDVGMSPLDQILTNLRLAPAQIAGWGHPVTTGSRHVDAYLSCRDMEPCDAQDHYAEPLVLLPGIGVDYAPVQTPASADRARFGLADDAHLYVCPQSLFKIHPATDALFFDILERDPAAQLLFFTAPARAQTDAFVARLTGGMSTRGLPMRNQVKLVPHVSREHFVGLLASCDVMLDPLHWSGGNTALDALSVGLPIVTLPGGEMRGRQSAAMLRLVGAEELIASNPREYVTKALQPGADRDYRAGMSARIREGLPRLFHRADWTRAFAEAVEAVHARGATTASRASRA